MRLFFALWPDDVVRAGIAVVAASIAARAGGRAVPAAKLHLTLTFLGDVADERVADAVEAASSVRGRGFEVVLDVLGSFRDARVAWAGLSSVPPGLAALQSSLDLELRERNFALDDRPFAAHATLARRIAKSIPREAMAPIAWNVREFVLVRSETGRGSYTVMERWKLEG
ncbi:MAG TPA: RNA 2',3'-cyclic phosphodiesterase [Usitatibacter sp.]|nr:RNA 2',3'-cyclic phosphodiesterase [Usitatibacter sp.]